MRCIAVFLVTLTYLPTEHISAVHASEAVSVEVKAGQTIRDIADVHLKDPNLWKTILRFNDIKDAAAVVPGQKLRIPVALVRHANQRRDAALGALQRATEAGAKVFARQLIGEAVVLYDAALSSRKDGEWERSAQEASEAEKKFQAAYAEAMSKREAKVQAVLDYRKNIVCARQEDAASWDKVPKSVCTQKQVEAGWREALSDDLIVEKEKVRTGSASEAGIVIHNVGDKRLGEYSQLTVGSMHVDRLTRKTETTFQLDYGTVTVRGQQSNARNQTKIRVENDPQVQIESTSQNYSVIHNRDKTKVTNLDKQPMEVAAHDESVTLHKNERTTIRNGQHPGPPTSLRPGPELASPGDDEVLFKHHAQLTWTPLDDTIRYWLEVAPNRSFGPSVINNWRIKKSQFFVGHLPTGDYYWRVAAFDSTGDDSAKSKIRRFSLRSDPVAPYLMVESPKEGTILRQTSASLSGRTDRDSTLTLTGQAVPVEPDGRFELDHRFDRGLNELILEARDPTGRVATVQRNISYLPDDKAVIRFDPSLSQRGTHHFLTRFDTMALTGTTEPGWQLQVRSKSDVLLASSFADDKSGRFELNISVNGEREELTFRAVSPSGFYTQEQLTVTKDQTPPAIVIDEDAPLPPATKDLEISLRGKAEGAATATLNEREIKLDEGRFDELINLTPSKTNRLMLTVRDLAGNEVVASWTIRHDDVPPKHGRPVISYRNRSGKRIANIKVKARDASGLKKAAPYQLRIGESVKSGFLKLDRKGRTYQDNVPVPKKTKAKLLSVELSDYAGNRRNYVFK
jgi:hypothetical protein